MKIAFKKEWLFKYKFWLMLAVIPPAAGAAFFILGAVAAETAKKEESNKSEAKQALVPPPPKQINEEGIEKLRKEAERVKKEEITVWQIAYKEQEPIFRLPRGFVEKVHTKDGLFAEDVRVLDKKKLADCPPDQVQAQFVHGEVVDITQQYFTLKVRDKEDKNKQMKFLRTPSIKILGTYLGKEKQDIPFIRIKLRDVLSVFYQVGKYFGDQFTEPEREEFKKYYRTQLPAIIDQLEPYNPVKGEGVVQLAGFGPEQIVKLREWARDEDADPPTPSKSFHFMPKFNMKGKNSKDDSASDDIWIAQEDLWIQEELFRLIRVANDFVSKFEPVEDAKAEKNKEAIFRNPYWEVALKLDDNNLHAKFTNLLAKRQKLDFKLKILMSDAKNAEPEVITLPLGPPLNPKGTKGGGDTQTVDVKLKKGITRNGIHRVEQVLTWETAAVRRVEGVYISKVGNIFAAGHRGFPDALLGYPNRWSTGPMAAAASGVAAPPNKGAAPGANPPAGGAAPKPMVGGGGPGGETPNGQSRERYTKVPEQLRRLPVAVALIVEQGQVDRVQTAFNNSKFRFLTTQVLMTHYAGSVRPPSAESMPAPVDPIKQPGTKPFPMPPMDPAKLAPPVRGPRAPAAANDELEANVELVIYGIITIYERIPGRVKNPNPS